MKPNTTIRLHELANEAAFADIFDEAFGKNVGPDGKLPLVWAAIINVLAVICAVVMDKFPCNGTSAA